MALELLAQLSPTSPDAKTALLAGIIVGVTLMVGLVGFLAWREKQAADEAEKPVPAAVEGAKPPRSGAGPGSR